MEGTSPPPVASVWIAEEWTDCVATRTFGEMFSINSAIRDADEGEAGWRK